MHPRHSTTVIESPQRRFRRVNRAHSKRVAPLRGFVRDRQDAVGCDVLFNDGSYGWESRCHTGAVRDAPSVRDTSAGARSRRMNSRYLLGACLLTSKRCSRPSIRRTKTVRLPSNANVTGSPSLTSRSKQLVEAFQQDTAPRWLLRDRDSIYDDTVRRRIAGLGITEVVSSPRSPGQSPYVERVIGSIGRECLIHVIVLGERHLRWILRSYVAYYRRSRTHLALDKDAPDHRSSTRASGRFIATPEVGGLHHRYDREAA